MRVRANDCLFAQNPIIFPLLNNLLVQANEKAIPFPETIGVIKELKTKYKLGLITNTSYQSYQSLQDKYKVTDLFDAVVTSFECGIIKPDPRIFQLTIEMLKIEKEEVLMVGDSLKDDTEASETFGIKGILIDRKDKYPDYPVRIKTLEDINRYL